MAEHSHLSGEPLKATHGTTHTPFFSLLTLDTVNARNLCAATDMDSASGYWNTFARTSAISSFLGLGLEERGCRRWIRKGCHRDLCSVFCIRWEELGIR